MEKANWFADANCDFSKNSRSTRVAVVVEAVVNVRSLTRGICEEVVKRSSVSEFGERTKRKD